MSKILVVDDESDLEILIKQKFRQKIRDRKYEFVFAVNGKNALEKIRENEDVDIVLSDINMPVMDGLQFLEARRDQKLAEGVPVVMITTEGSEPFVLRALAAGAQGYICKPFTADQVKARVVPLLEAA